jgi:tetratricopeptide (TPR) repeat protein
VPRSRSTSSASLALLLSACASGAATQTASVPVTPAALVQPGATKPPAVSATPSCRLLATPGQRAQSLAAARRALARSPADRAAAFALARCTHLHADVEQDDARVIALSEEGMAALDHAALPPDDAEAAYLYSLNLGLFLRARGMMAVGRLSELVAKLKLAGAMPALDDGGPLRVLGLLYVKAPGWPVGPGDLDAALELLHRAVREYPGHPLNHVYLAYALVDAGERAQARDELLRARELCQAARFGDWAARWRQEADELLARALVAPMPATSSRERSTQMAAVMARAQSPLPTPTPKSPPES